CADHARAARHRLPRPRARGDRRRRDRVDPCVQRRCAGDRLRLPPLRGPEATACGPRTVCRCGRRGRRAGGREPPLQQSPEGGFLMIWLLVALIIAFAIVGGVAVTKFLFFLLVAAALIALIGLVSRSA